MKRAALVALVVASLGGALYFFFGRGEERAPIGALVTATRGDLVELASATGTIVPDVQIEILSRASGEVREVLVREGQVVEEGAPLLRLDPFDADRAVAGAVAEQRRALAQLREARASLAVAEADAAEAGTASELTRRGHALGLVAEESARTSTHQAGVSARQVELRQAQVAAARAGVESARLAVSDAERRRTETEIVAPITGTVLTVKVERGSVVTSALTNVNGGQAIMTIADLADLRVIGAIDESQIRAVAVDQDVHIRVDAYPDRVYTGRVYRVSPLGVSTSDVVTFDVEIVVTDERASELRSGMSADVEIITARQQSVLLVPLTAVRSHGDEHTVLLPNGEPRNIETGSTDGTSVIVLSGLNEGDQIAADPSPDREEGPSGGGGLFGRRRRR